MNVSQLKHIQIPKNNWSSWIRFSVLLSFTLSLTHCNSIKRVPKGKNILYKTEFEVDSFKQKDFLKNLLHQKENSKTLGIFPLKLHIYNLARPKIDSILNEKFILNTKRAQRNIAWLSKKQFIRKLNNKKKFNTWLKNNGEAPVVYNEKLSEQSIVNLKNYFFNQGWFDAHITYSTKKDSSKKVTLTYKIDKKQPYIIGKVEPFIKSVIIDSIYKKNSSDSYIKPHTQYQSNYLINERKRITDLMRDSGVYHFNQDYINFDVDTLNTQHIADIKIFIKNRNINTDPIDKKEVPFKIYTIGKVKINTEFNLINQNSIQDSVHYKGYTLYFNEKLKYNPKSLIDAIYVKPGGIYKNSNRSKTLNHLHSLNNFKYPSISYTENKNQTLDVIINLVPLTKYKFNIDTDVSQSNYQALGLALSLGFRKNNLFKGAENLEFSGSTAIGASKDRANPDDPFFDINEIGGLIRLTIPKIVFPINTRKIIPNFMFPKTQFSLGTNLQTNIGLDKQSLNGFLKYQWTPKPNKNLSLDLFNLEYIRNLNTNTQNYFNVFNNSFQRLNNIAISNEYIPENTSLRTQKQLGETLSQADQFVTDVIAGNFPLSLNDFRSVIGIAERRNRISQDNLVFSTNFLYTHSTQLNKADRSFTNFKAFVESSGNFLSLFSSVLGGTKNDMGQRDLFNVIYSQYIKGEIELANHWEIGAHNDALVFRGFAGLALPYGNLDFIPFSRSYYAGGPNDNRGWAPYDLGPGKFPNLFNFNEGNLKLAFNLEYRFTILGGWNGAFFIDAGNIWNYKNNLDFGEFVGLKSLNELAVGSGFGLRYDFSLLVARLDFGFKTYNPSEEHTQKWFRDYNFANTVINIGINYPF